MRAAFISSYGRHQKLEIGELPTPEVGPEDVLVEVRAASVNPIDFKIRDGQLKFLRKYSFPLVLGHDLAGRVVAIGSKVTRFKMGDEIYARPRNDRIGTFAEFIAVDQLEAALKPKNLSFSEAAGIPLVGLTCWQAMVDLGKVRPGQNVLIQAGAGGIGTFAIQLAKHLGAFVTTTASKRNEVLVRSLGADRFIDYHSIPFESAVRDQDFVFDTLGGDALYKSFGVTKPGGHVVSISGDPDIAVARDFGLGPVKTAILALVGMKARRLARKHGVSYHFIFMKPRGQQLEMISHLIESGIIRPVIDREVDLSQAQLALEHSERGHAKGKIIIVVKK